MMEPSTTRSLADLHSFDSFCDYNITCPPTCPCCSVDENLRLSMAVSEACVPVRIRRISPSIMSIAPRDSCQIFQKIFIRAPLYLDLAHNRIKAMKSDLSRLTQLKHLSLAHNRLESLVGDQLAMTTHLEHLDLSSNQIKMISTIALSNLHQLQQLHLHDNPWIPHFYYDQNEFQSNVRLALLTYANGLICNRSSLGAALSAADCCQHSTDLSCQPAIAVNRTEQKLANALLAYRNQTSSAASISLFDRKYRSYTLIGSSVCLLLFICCILLYLHHRKRSLLAKSTFLSPNDMGKKTNHYDKPLIPTRNRSERYLLFFRNRNLLSNWFRFSFEHHLRSPRERAFLVGDRWRWLCFDSVDHLSNESSHANPCCINGSTTTTASILFPSSYFSAVVHCLNVDDQSIDPESFSLLVNTESSVSTDQTWRFSSLCSRRWSIRPRRSRSKARDDVWQTIQLLFHPSWPYGGQSCLANWEFLRDIVDPPSASARAARLREDLFDMSIDEMLYHCQWQWSTFTNNIDQSARKTRSSVSHLGYLRLECQCELVDSRTVGNVSRTQLRLGNLCDRLRVLRAQDVSFLAGEAFQSVSMCCLCTEFLWMFREGE